MSKLTALYNAQARPYRQRRQVVGEVGRRLLGLGLEGLAAEHGIEALDRRDDDLGRRVDLGAGEPLDPVELGELAVVVVGPVAEELGLRLLAEGKRPTECVVTPPP